MRQYDEYRKPAVYPNQFGAWPDGSTAGRTPHLLAGRRIVFQDRSLDDASEMDCATLGALVKFIAAQNGPTATIPPVLQMSEEDTAVLSWALTNCKWVGEMQEEYKDNWVTLQVKNRRLTAIEAVEFREQPERFNLIPAPVYDAYMAGVLQRSLFLPFVKCVTIKTGRRIRGGSMMIDPTTEPGEKPTEEQVASVPPPSKMVLRDTEMVMACAALETDRLTESDPAKLGRQCLDQFAPKHAEWFDRVIVNGDGYSEPLGILKTPGGNRGKAKNGTAGPPVLGDYEEMLLGVHRAFRCGKDAFMAFIGSDHSYRRARAMRLDSMADERRVFGPAAAQYELFGVPYMVSEEAPHHTTAAVNLSKYRLYIRPGIQMRFEYGSRISTDAPKLLVWRHRQGGQMENEWAVAITEDCQG